MTYILPASLREGHASICDSGLADIMNKLLWIAIFTLLFTFPSSTQVSRGSLVVWIVSRSADYVVIGAESRAQRPSQSEVDDRSCKLISLGNHTLFYETGISEMTVGERKPWSSQGTARHVYASSPKHDALSLATDWGHHAMQWFSGQPDQVLQSSANRVTGNLVTAGFINFDRDARLSLHTANLAFNDPNRGVQVAGSSTAPGHIGVAGMATELVREFFEGKTERAARAAPVVGPGQVGVNSAEDARLVRAAIRFAIDHAIGAERLALGGDIDLAILTEDGNIRWLARKSWCSREDL